MARSSFLVSGNWSHGRVRKSRENGLGRCRCRIQLDGSRVEYLWAEGGKVVVIRWHVGCKTREHGNQSYQSSSTSAYTYSYNIQGRQYIYFN